MTLVVYALAALMSAAGTRLAAAGFLGAAALAVVSPGRASPVTAATAATAALLVLTGTAPRRLAIPAIGAAAVIAAGSAGNAAIVLALWTIGTTAAVVCRPTGRDGSRWAFGLLQADLLVAAAVVYTALNSGFASWPHRLGDVGAGILLVSALLRLPAVGWPEDAREPGLVLVRAQAIVLMTIAVRAAGHDLLTAGAVTGAVLFGAGAIVRIGAVRDAAQEAGLVLLTLSATGLGWMPMGWTWGAVIGGTLMHQLRLMSGPGDELSALARAMDRSGGIGLPLLPAAGAVVAAALPRSGPLRVSILLFVAAGLAGRTLSSDEPERKPAGGSTRYGRALVIAAAGVASLVAAVVALPRPPGGDQLAWPAVWTAGIVAAAALAGWALPALAPDDEPPDNRPVVSVPIFERVGALLDPPAGSTALVGLLSVLAALGAGLLVVGWLRGFL